MSLENYAQDWMIWIFASAVMLAFYDIVKKASVRGNAVIPVLLVSTLAGLSAYALGLAAVGGLRDAAVATPHEHLLVAVKSLLAGSSWVFTFWALRTLPITIATPIRASSPALVFVVAFFMYGERPGLLQGVGMALVFVGYWAFAWAGRHEGIDFLRSRAVWLAICGMCFSAASALWDKFILQKCAIPPARVQLWFQIGLVVIYVALFASLRLSRLNQDRFEWRWTIPLTGVLLAVADYLYFHGLALPDVHISVASLLRRFSVVISFVVGAVVFHERNLRRKGLALASVLVGIALICL